MKRPDKAVVEKATKQARTMNNNQEGAFRERHGGLIRKGVDSVNKKRKGDQGDEEYDTKGKGKRSKK